MITTGWNEYRGWALRARLMQAAARRWYVVAFAFAVIAAVLGTAAGQAPSGTTAKVLTALAGVFAAITPLIAHYILEVGSEAAWIRARSTAEAIKSECFRLAGKVGVYAQADAAEHFRDRLVELAAAARNAGLAPAAAAVEADARCPPEALTPEWYVQNRLDEQTEFYRKAQQRHETAATRLSLANLVLAVIAAVLGVLGAVGGFSWLGPWVGVVTTIGAMLIASGLLERRKFLAGSYGNMVTTLQLYRTRFAESAIPFPALVGGVEDLLGAEHATWRDRMSKAIPLPVAPKGAPAASPA